MYVLDTNVVSELRKVKAGKADPRVAAWAASTRPAALYLSAVTVLELEIGVMRAERRDAEHGRLLRHWFEGHVLPTFAGRILAMDEAVARVCARLHVPDPASDRDAIIAATALVHAMTLVTRNVTDFARTGAVLLDPWKPMP